MLGGLGTMSLAVGGWTLAWLLGAKSPVGGPRRAALLVLLVFTCGATSLVNPFGPSLPLTWLQLMS
jgi:hypothetical protein